MPCATCKSRSYVISGEGDFAVARVCECARPCKVCGGSGYVLGTREETFSQKVGPRRYDVLGPCTCRVLEGRVARFCEAKVPAAHARAEFEGYRPFGEESARARDVAMKFALGYRRGERARGYVLSGPVGSGKTHLLSATLAHVVMEAGARGEYVEISHLYANIRRGFQEGKSGGEIIRPLSEVELLAIDEMGKGRLSPFELETLDELISRRYNAGRTTLFATNYSLRPPERARAAYVTTGELKEAGKESQLLYDRVGDRIYSRLCEMCDFVELPRSTPDHRRQRQELR
ncbi:MAG TPA: ATP-binding protein [Myxococcales bacterium]|jgi:DNA replication protein DnaC|nr:ATP-binding protein [Myxococcales bacterium]